jgi:hypothetical protein
MIFSPVLLLVFATTSCGHYVDEPLFFDTFPTNFIWAAATSAHQVLRLNFLKFDKKKLNNIKNVL